MFLPIRLKPVLFPSVPLAKASGNLKLRGNLKSPPFQTASSFDLNPKLKLLDSRERRRRDNSVGAVCKQAPDRNIRHPPTMIRRAIDGELGYIISIVIANLKDVAGKSVPVIRDLRIVASQDIRHVSGVAIDGQIRLAVAVIIRREWDVRADSPLGRDELSVRALQVIPDTGRRTIHRDIRLQVTIKISRHWLVSIRSEMHRCELL